MSQEDTPDLIDILVIGGGPAGTAAAFRASELGLSVLVIDYDDLMKRIRDYAKDKLILPSFGGGDQMCFPKGGDLVECLQFDPIDKDDMCVRWKALYKEHGIATEIGAELTGLERTDAGYQATAWNHKVREEREFQSRAVVLALGRGVPRRFDIPGNADGIAYRLSDPERFVGRPACIVGGGTSAAEAVIAVSNAKAAASDATAVYWSYRGEKMPRVSKALADEFFAAYMGNGNIRYQPKSEPAAIFVGDDRQEYLAVRVDRRVMEDRPGELAMLEFHKEQCLACIGEDIPEKLLNSFGIEMVRGGSKNRKRMVVNRYLESRQPGIYLVGDLLSQAYFETDDFDSDPETYREVKHRGNVKSALRDGVRVAQIIQQRLAGATEIDTSIEEVEAAAAAAEVPEPVGTSVSVLAKPLDRGGPPPESQAPERPEAEAEAVLVRVLPTGVEAEEYALEAGGVTTIGSAGCDVTLPDDSMLAPRHASISHGADGYFVRDDGGATGVFLRVPAAKKVGLAEGDLLRAGRQFLVVAKGEEDYAFTHHDATGKEVGRIPLKSGETIVLGRDAPHVTLDRADGTLSRRHLALSVANGKPMVKDLKSVNGTFLRVRDSRRLEHGDRIRLGSQAFVFSLRREAVLDEGKEVPVAVALAESAAPAEVEPGAPVVTFKDHGAPLPVASGQTLCEVAEAAGIPFNAECHSGICGSDPVRILSGAENLADGPADQESETLEEICELEPGPCRLACMLRIKGPVEVEILKT